MYMKINSLVSLAALLTLQASASASMRSTKRGDVSPSDYLSSIGINHLAPSATVKGKNGLFHTYYQGSDGSILEINPSYSGSSGSGSGSGSGYSSSVVVPAGVAKANTPIAASSSSWGNDDDDDDEVYNPIPSSYSVL